MQELFEVIKSSSEGGISQSPLQIIINLSMALVLGWIYAYVYRLTYVRKKGDKDIKREMKGIQYTLLLLSIGGAFIWIVVADNLVRAFGLAGALSLIRFRTRVIDPSNTIKVFYAIIIGMACGLSQYYAAILGTVFMCLVLTLIYYLKQHEKRQKEKKKAAEAALLAAEQPEAFKTDPDQGSNTGQSEVQNNADDQIDPENNIKPDKTKLDPDQ